MTDANLTTLTISSFSFPDIQVSGNRVERFGRRSFELAASILPTDDAIKYSTGILSFWGISTTNFSTNN